MVNRKLAIRDEPNIGLRCSRNVKKTHVLPMKNTRLTTTPLSSSPPCVQNASMCTFKTSPSMPAPRAHDETHVRVVPANTGTSERAHGDVLDGHAEVFQRVTSHTTTHRNTPQGTATHHNGPQHTTTHRNINHHHRNTRSQREKRRQDEIRKTKHEKTREDKT